MKKIILTIIPKYNIDIKYSLLQAEVLKRKLIGYADVIIDDYDTQDKKKKKGKRK